MRIVKSLIMVGAVAALVAPADAAEFPVRRANGATLVAPRPVRAATAVPAKGSSNLAGAGLIAGVLFGVAAFTAIIVVATNKSDSRG